MATRYVDSNATGAADGTSWTDAYTTLAAVAAVDTAGDIIYVAHNHAESTASAVSLNWAGTAASPTTILCVNTGTGALATTAVVATTGASTITPVSAGQVYMYGIAFKSGDSTNNGSISFISGNWQADYCVFELSNTNSSARICSASGSSRVVLRNCTFKFGNATQCLLTSIGSLDLINCVFDAGTTSPTVFVGQSTSDGECRVIGCDFTNLSSSFTIAQGGSSGSNVSLINCRLPASWSGGVTASTLSLPLVRMALYNSDSTDTNFLLWIEDSCGSIKHETTLVRTGGATDGTTALSWNLTSNANAKYLWPLLTDEIVLWNETTGSSVTVTAEILHDSATNLKDDEVWLEVQYLGTSGYPITSSIHDSKADYVATGADQTTSSATWTTTGMSNPNKQKLSVTFTPQEKGFFHARVALGKASYTVYVCPKLTVS